MGLLCKEKILSNEYADWIIDFELTQELQSLDQSGVDYCYDPIDEFLGLVYARRNQMAEIGLLNYSYQQIPAILALPKVTLQESNSAFDSTALMDTGILNLQKEPLNLSGENTVIALIGTGIDYTNPIFKRPDGSSRILAIWDQTIEGGSPPKTAVYGSEYQQEQINQALQAADPFSIVPSRDEQGITTAVAGVAAGNNSAVNEIFIGAAPQADLVIVKLKECKPYLREYYLLPNQAGAYQATDIIKALQYADSFARDFFRPIIFCLLPGTNYGSHSGTTPLSQYLERLGRKRGRVVVISGGDEGSKGHHYSGSLRKEREEEGETGKEEIEIRVGENENGFLMEMWGSLPARYRVGIRSPAGEVLPTEASIQRRGISYEFIYGKTKITINYAPVDSITGDQVIVIRVEKPTEGIWTLIVEGENPISQGKFHIWLPNQEFLSAETYFLKPDPDITLMVPSYTENAICTSSYVHQTNSFFVESGRGFSRGIQKKPDLASPAVNISSPIRSLPKELRIGKQSSTAFSSAFMAGAAALFLQWAFTVGNMNYLNSNEVKSYFMIGAKRESERSYPNREWGYGSLSLQGVFDELAGR